MRTLLGLLAVVSLVGCGDDGGKGGGDGGAEDGGAHNDGLPIDGTSDGAMVDAMIDGPPGTTALKVKNYAAWCLVSVNGGAESQGTMQTVNVTPGDITLTARGAGVPPNSSFIVFGNMWHHTDGDTGGTGETGAVTGAGENKISTAHITVGSTAACAWVCCPFPNMTGCEATIPDQCP